MNRQEALYFMEGLTCALAAPSPRVVKVLYHLLSDLYEIDAPERDAIRAEIDGYLDRAEGGHE